MSSEKLALAAHLHVVVRRHVGRVTDVEWLATDLKYAREIIVLARSSGHQDCLRWAEKFAAVVEPHPVARAEPGHTPEPSNPELPRHGRNYIGGIR